MLNISSKMKKILTTIISLIVLVGIGVATNMVVTNNNIQLNSKAHKAPSIEERRAINGTVNVTFDAYFLNNSERTNEALLGPIVGPIVRTIPTKDIYMELSVVGDGYLKDGKILLQPTNGKISTTLVTDNVINGTYVGTPNEIKLKNVQSGTTRIIKGVVNPWILGKDYFLRNDNKIIFKGTYVSADGQETPLEKEVRYTVESMYEYIKAYSEKSYTRYTEIPKEYYSKDTKPHANFRIFNRGEQINESSRRTHNNYVAITSNTVKDLEYRAIVPEFNGYKAESVQVIVNNKLKNENVTTTYNKDTRELIIKYKEIGYDQNTLIEVVYPKESGDSKASEEVEITGTLRILADNNPKYTNPLEDIVTSTDKRKIEYYEIAELRYYPNYIDILKAPTTDNPLDRYDGNTTLAKTEEYSVVWRPYSEEMTTNEIELTENKRKYGDTLGASEINIKDVVVNTGIKFTIKPENLTENSTIKIYDDETNELIREYNKTEILENNDRDNKYNRPVKHVKIVLNNIKIHNRSDNYFIHYKEINDEELIKLTNKEAFEKLSYIKTGLTQKIGTTSVYAEDSTAYRKTSEPTVDIRLYDHNKINEQIAYNGIKQEKDNDITYHMTMYFTKGTKGIRLVDENGFSLLRADGNFENGVNASEYIKYKGIYFYQNQKLVDNFNLKIYDNDTNELLATFTKADIEKYNKEEKAFIYPEKVKHIRIDSNDNISMLHIINIDNNKLVQNVDLNTYIDEIKYIGIKSKFARIVEEGQEYTKFKDIATTGDAFIQKSRIDAEIDKPVNTYQKQKDITNTIYLRDVAKDNKGYYEQTFKGWKDSTILIEYPEEIKKVEINKIIPSDENIKILGYDKFEFEGKQYLKIYIKSDVEYKDQSININENLTADPLAKSKNALAKIYYYNAYPVEHSQYETETADKFDINNNGRTDDIIGLSSFSISIVSPDTLVVTQEMTGYNTKNETTYAPGTGIIESNGSGTATVKIQLANYWTPTVSNVKLIGKIPFRNNITPLSKQTLKSTFSTTMTEDGIQLPEELKSFAKVYYSELEDPGVNEVSAWKEKSQVTNWNNIKSFYIDLGSKILNPQEKQTITYKVNVPLDTPVNERTYSTVAATFDLNTERDGNLSSTAESNKVGIQLLKRYNLNVSSLVKGKTNPVADSVYSVENNEDDEDLAISKTVVTDQSGNAIVKDLRVNEEYTLTEKSIDSNYEERNIKIKFKLVEQNGRLELQVTEGNEYVKEKSEVQPTERTNAIANIKFEYLKKYKITINKKSEKTKENLKYVAYKLSGNDNSTSQQGSTDENGNLTFSSLKTNVIYTLTETFAPKHYLNAPITFRATETNGVPNIELLSGHSESISISETNEKQNQANISIFDEKVKTYTLKVVKYEKGNLNKRLKNAQFLIKGDGIPNGKVIETDENGEATLTDLYEYKEGQSYKGEYTIEELVAPEGYKGKYKVGVLVKRDAAQIARVHATTTELDIKNAESDHPTVYFFVPNEPLFKIIKKDAKTQELLPNTKFAIVKVDESGRESEALDINDNPVGTQEEINGKTYRTILTDEKGEYTAGLKAGRYKFIELQASNDKYDLPEKEEDRTYTVNVGEATKAKYVLKENTNISRAIDNRGFYESTGIKVTYVNGQSVTYKITDENDKKYLNVYDKEFNVTKKIELKNMREINQSTEVNIGKDGSIYVYSEKIGTTKFDSEGNFLYRSNDGYFGGIYNNGIRGPSNQFGSFLIDNDNKILSGRKDSSIDVYSNISSAKLLSNYDRQKRIVKPSFFGGFLELVYNHSNGVVNIYNNDLSIEKTFNINTKYKSGEWILFNIANIYEDTEGNIYVENTDENKIDVYNREGTLLKQINKLGNEFTVLPDGRIYFIDFKHEEKNQINVKLILTENNGDKIYEKSLENVRYWPYENKLGININADGSIDYTNSDENNMYSEMINHRLDLEIETPAQPPQSEIVVENKLKKFKITTSSSIGGTISGKGENPYEEVEINSDSNKPIEIKADEGYVIAKIVINGEEYPISDEHNITLTKFNNITEDKNINVVFDLASNVARYKIQTFHYLKGTNTEVAPTVINYYNERENTYITEPKILEKYELEKNEQGEYIIPTNATGDAITANKTGNNSVIYYYVKKKAKVITKYILEKTDGSTEEIKPTDEQTLEVDSEYRTSGEINNTKYELIRIDGNARGTIESTEDINVTYVYKLKDAKVNVKYLDVTESETGTPLSSRDGTIIADKVINGQVDDAYRTQEAENVQPNYSLVETPRNASGTMTIDPITVVYKYRKVTPTINDINVTKVGPNKIVSKNQLNTYNITFNVDISNYIGSGKVRLTDKLPYEIHYEDIDKLATGLFLDGGIYNNETKEIIWDIPITDINTYKQADDRNENNVVITQNGNSAHITINKTISIRYKDLPNYNQGEEPKIENSIFGKVILDRNNEREVNSKYNSPANYNTAIIVKKKWNDNSNSAEKRPTSITFALYKTINGQETKVKDYTLTGNKTTNDGWETKIEQLPIYDGVTQSREIGLERAGELGNRITYRVEETTNNKFYQSAATTHSENEFLLTNTFTVPDEKIEVQVNKVWDDNSNANAKRPTSIKYVLNGGKSPVEQVVTGNTTTNDGWGYKFTNLAKYDDLGNEITYTVSEQEATTDGLKFYTNRVSGEYKTGLTITNTFTVPDNKVEVIATKHWEDANNANGKRPLSIKYVLNGGRTPIEQVVSGNRTTDADWAYTFTNLPKYDAQGNEISYSVDEQEVNSGHLKFYTKSKLKNRMINTFTVPDEKINVPVTKHWEDGNNANGKRPTSIKYVLTGNGLTKEQVVTGNTTSDADWNYTFTNLPKYDAQGNEIAYTVEEQEVNANDLKFYAKSKTNYDLTNTFKVPNEKIEVSVTKHWEDNSNANGKRPVSVKYVLTGNGLTKEQIVTGNSTTDDNWSYTFTDLPKYNSQGNEIIYTVDEKEANTDGLKFYQKSIRGSNIINTFTVPDDKIEVAVTKTWLDSNNANRKRPTSVKYIVSGNGLNKEQVVTGNSTTDADWNYTFTNLPKYDAQGNEIVYTIDEQEVNPNDFKFYTKQIDGSEVTNTFTVPDDKLTIKIVKTWQDNENEHGKRPTSIKYILKGGKTEQEKEVTGNRTTTDGWEYVFTDLPKYNEVGDEYIYKIEEEITENAHLYQKQISSSRIDDETEKFDVLNTFEVPNEKVEVPVTKHWEDNSNANGKRPASIKYVLKGGASPVEKVVSGNTITDENWGYTFTNLPKYNESGDQIRYTIEEQEVNANDLKFYTKSIRGYDVTNTFSVPDEKVEVQVNKTWADDNNANAKRPASVKYVLTGNEQTQEKVVTGNRTTDDGWSYKFTDLPKYNDQGNIIDYTVDEQEVNPGDLKFYTKSVRGFNVTNTFTVPDEKIEVQVNKTWVDDNNANSKRPASIKYVLSGNGLTKEQVVTGNTSTNDNWSYKFTDLPKYNGQGNEIVYTIDEQEVNPGDFKFYAKSITGLNVTNTFTVPDDKIEVQVNKTWADDNNVNGKRPVSIKYVLTGNGLTKEQVVTGNSTSNENWSYKFTDLPKYNAQGNEIVYTLDEQEVSPNDLKFYEKSIKGFDVTNTFKVPDEKIELTATKTWNDESNKNAKRPASIKYVLSGNGVNKEQVVTGNSTTNEDWSYKFTDLPKYNAQGNEISYTLDEQEVNANDLKFYTKQIAGLNITNTFTVPDEKIEVQVNKVWEDNSNANAKRPTSIKYVLSGNGQTQEQVVSGTATTDESWSYKFTNLPKYNAQGNEISYTVSEKEVNTDDLKFYTNQISGEYKSGINITNKFTVPDNKIEIEVTKTWEDNSNANDKRPTSIKYVLSGDGKKQEQIVTGNSTTNADWNYTFTNLPKYNSQGNVINYSLEEKEVNQNDLKFYSKEVNGFKITNTFKVPGDKISVKVTKHWEDNSNANSKRPTSIKYILKGGKEEKTQVVTGNTATDANWNYTFTELPKYNENGQEYQYSVEEEIIENAHLYTKAITSNTTNEFNVVNTFKVPADTINIPVTKHWEDNSNVNGKRPASIKYILKGGSTPIEKVVTGSTTTDDNWNYTFTDLPKYNSQGNEIAYTIDEQEVNQNDLKFYKKSINKYSITNTFTVPDEKTEVQVNKTWEDNSNVNGKRPASIKYVLTGNGLTKEQTVTGSTTTNENWSYKFTNLPKYNAQGNEIVYTVDEQEVNQNDLKFYTKQVTGLNVTNTFTVPDEKIEVQVNKSWEDNSNANGKRPTSIKYVLTGNGLTKDQTVTGSTTTNDNWSYKFTDLPKYDAQGNEIVYTVAEQEATTDGLKFYSNEISGEYKTGITIKNTFKVPEDKIELEVTKHWEDNSNINGKRPISIKYVVSGNNKTKEEIVTGNTTTDENWNYKFTDLAKYDSQGNEIVYTIDEQEVTPGDLKFYNKSITGLNIVNTFHVPDERISVNVSKHWEDNSNINGKRPESIKYVLTGEGNVTEQVVTGNTTNDTDWNYTFTNLPKYNAQGNEIIYTIEEQEANQNDLKFYVKQANGNYKNGFNMVNTFKVPLETVDISVNKHWADDNNANGKRPTSIKYVLSGNNQTKEQTVTGSTNSDADWNYIFTNLLKYNSQGNEIVYTVDEQEVNPGDFKFYTKQVAGLNVTNTFTVPNDKIEVQVNKVWEDNSNANAKRPISIKYVLSGNGLTKEQTVTGNTSTNEDWSYKFTDLPKYNAQGNEIVYTVAEQETTTDGLKFYTNEISGEYKTGITIKNKFKVPEDKIEVEVTKHWVDNNNVNHRRPTSIKYVLKGNGLTKEQEVIGNISTDENWNYTFTNLPKYNAQGNEIVYTVDEQEVNPGDLKFYSKEVNGFNVTNTFKVPEDKVNIKATKTWIDSSNAKGKRPSSIKYILKGGATPIEKVVSGNNTSDENWSYTFENLAKYDSNGQEYQYSVEEEIAENVHLYTKVITGNKESGFNVINTFKVPEDKITIAVTKEWKDNSNVAGKRPTSIKYVLKGGATPIEEVVSGNNTTNADWNHTFTNVAKYNDSGDEITYTLEEQEVSANDFKFYKKAISGDYKSGFNVVNTFEVPDEKVEVQVNKVWEDDSNANTKRPASIKYILKGGATPVEHVVTGKTNSNADWSYKFTNLPKYSATGDEITYTLEEQEVNTDELKFYEKEITGSMNAGFNVKNKFKVPEDKVEARITKTWEDNSNVNGKRPASIKYVLSGNGSTKEQTVTGNTTTNDNWSYTFTNLPKYNSQGNEITYIVEEQEVNPGDLKFYEKQVNGNYQSGFNVTNTFRIPNDKVKVEITKKWEDSSNVSNKRPASVKVELSDGANVVRTQELTGTGNEWKYIFTDLPKYNSQGNTITYTLDEKEVNPGDLQFYTKSIVGNTITNTFTQSTDKINVNVSKTWNDSNNANRKRPVSIKYVLKNKETVASEKVVAGNETTDADWNYTFTGLAKYDEHNDEIKYTLEEQEANEGELKFYTKQVNGDYKVGFDVVNTFKVPDERINVNVSKTWNDNSNANNKRPASIKYVLSGNGSTVEQIVTGESNTDTNWSYEFSNLVKYEANTGNEISYTVREEEVNPGDLKFYEPTISGDYKAGINVTNKFVVPNDKVTPKVTITWEDNNNNGNKRPSNVKIIVKDKEGKVVKEGNITGNPTDEEWNKVFENVPKYDKNGDPIPYTVEEKPNSPDDFKFYKITVTGDIDKGYKVTNKFEVPDEKVTVKVKKVWEDSNNAASKRPTAIKVQLKNNAAIVREERVTGSGNEWTYTFENVAKYNGYGDVINYTVEEIEEQTEDLKFYEKKITGDKDSEYVITNKFKVPDEKIEINVNKTWEDNNNEANKRPQSIKYILKGGATDVEQVVSGNRTTDANWSYEFTNVKKYDNNANEIVYSVEEQEVNANDLKFYTKKISGEQTNGFAVVNKFTVPNEKVTVKVSKTWDDESNKANKRPSSIKYEVLNRNNQIVASKVQIGNKNTADGWSHNFELDKYDALGNEEVYNVQEVEVNQNDFKFYKATVSGNYKSGFTVTNKFEVPNEEVTPKISVEWKDNSNQNNKRPTSVKIQVKDEEGRIVKESPVTGLITEESWKKIFENVPKYNKNGDPINYTITEEPNNPNDLEFYTTTTSGNITEGFKVVNTYAVPGTTISLKANKKWIDGNNAKNKRPESIKIEVRNNNEVVADKEVKGNRTTDANWEVEFKNLPKYNPTTGAENVYTVTETEVHQGELRYYTSAVNGNTITNTIKPVTEGKIEDSKVEKESTLAKITKADEIIPYTITYKGKIKEYMGDAVVKIVDELPFKLDLSKSNITDGSYDDESKTITWIENLNNIDTHSNGDKEVEIKKEIKLVYKDLKILEDNLKVTNKVRAEISLKELNKKITENNTKEIPAEISSKVTVKYVLKSNRSMKLKEDKVITGHVGDAYQTTIPNDIDQDAYEFVEVEGNENGKISQEEKVVTYLYKKKFGKVVVSYVEKSTGMKLQNDEVIKGNINEPYNAEAKDIEYYNLVSTEKSENVKPVITEEDQKITHYYEKKVFNIEIDKELKEATIDGEKRTFRNGKFTKLDIPVKKILNSEVKVRYSINVKNTGEIKGTTVVQENIPKYFTMNPSENPDWRIENGKIVSKEIELNPGESKELSITLKWTNSKDNFGTLVNKAGIEKTKNNAGFEETDTEEEKKGKKQQATLVLVPKTGLDINKVLQMTGVGITLTALVAAMGYTISRKVRDEYINQ